MLLGNREESIAIGNDCLSMVAGNKECSIVAGNYKVDVTAGNIDIKTKLGSINIKTTLGTVTIKGSLGVKIESAIKVDVIAPLVNIGKLQPLQGIVTGGPAGHLDYITGLPLRGSFSTKASAI